MLKNNNKTSQTGKRISIGNVTRSLKVFI